MTRSHFFARAWHRARREAERAAAFVLFALLRPTPGVITIVTLNADEENATATAVMLAHRYPHARIALLSPDPDLAREAVREAARCLGFAEPSHVDLQLLTRWRLLTAYARSSLTLSTHVLLPGRDPSGKRTHIHLTHGSGPKPDTTFRGPTTVLASLVGVWTGAQLQEYQLPTDTRLIRVAPRLEIMRKAVGDHSVKERLGLDPSQKLLVWAPTYRSILKPTGETRVSGVPLTFQHHDSGLTIHDIRNEAQRQGWVFLTKTHPQDADDLRSAGIDAWTNADLRARGVTPYELFSVADLLITDYSSLLCARAALRLPVALFCPDIDTFSASYRGLRQPQLEELVGEAMIHDHADLGRVLTVSASEAKEMSSRVRAQLEIVDDAYLAVALDEIWSPSARSAVSA